MASLNKLAIRGTLWTFVGYGSSQFLRLAGNLVLTRLLVPEMFGLMALVNTFIIGLNLFSDIGIGPSIIQSKRGDDPSFLNTAWTIQVVRGLGLWICCCIIALPVSRFYGNPQLLWLLPIVGFSTIIAGFNSTALFTLNRKIDLGKLTRFEFIVQLLGLLVMIGWAWFDPSIWALVVGNLVLSVVKMFWSHALVTEPRNRLTWDRTALQEIAHFGRWIFISTAMTFLATQADRLILGKIFSLALLGVYTVAFTLAELPRQVLSRVNGKVMFPVIAQQIELPRPELRSKLLKKRWILLMILAIALGGMISFGDWLILFLYDDRYRAGAWMLPILAAGLWLPTLALTIDPVLYALGKPQLVAIGNFAKFAYMLIFIPLGFHTFGVLGAVIVVAANDLPYYLAVAYGVWQEKLSGFRQDLLATLLLLGVATLLITIRWRLGFGFPIQALWN
jgi:O-antigen/teichoic acid export membrane protein